MTISSIGGSSAFDPSQMAAKFFKKADANSDGGVDKAESKTMLANGPGGALGAADVDKAFAMVDGNGDGKIDASENDAAMKKMARNAGPHAGGARPAGAPPASGGGLASLLSSKTYDPADSNQDGKVSDAERLQYQQEQQSPYDRAGKQVSSPSATSHQFSASA